MRRICPVLPLCVFVACALAARLHPDVSLPTKVADRVSTSASALLLRDRGATPCVAAGEPPPPRPTIRDRNWQVPRLSGDDDLTGLCGRSSG